MVAVSIPAKLVGGIPSHHHYLNNHEQHRIQEEPPPKLQNMSLQKECNPEQHDLQTRFTS